MKRELKFFIDLFIECCEDKDKEAKMEEVKKLISGTYNVKIGENSSVVVLKLDDNSFSFNYVDLLTRRPVTSVKASLDEIRTSFLYFL